MIEGRREGWEGDRDGGRSSMEKKLGRKKEIRRENRKDNERGKKRRVGGKERKKWRRETGMEVVAKC